MESFSALSGCDLHLVYCVVWGDGDCGFALLGEYDFQRGTCEPVSPVEADAKGAGGGPCVGPRGMPRGGKIAEVTLKGWVVVGQGIELRLYPQAVTKGEGVFVPIGVAYVQ